MNVIVAIFLLFLGSLVFVLLSVVFLFYSERKLSAFMQDRIGPKHVGKSGLLQPLADLLKLIQKETIIPSNARKFLFVFAPFLIFASTFCGFALLPLWPELGFFSPLPGGILLLLGIISIEAIGIFIAGFSSQSKFSLLGAGRAVSQMLSYEIPLGIAILSFFWIANSAELSVIQDLQSSKSIYPNSGNMGWPISLLPTEIASWGGIFSWNIFRFPILLLLLPVFFVCIMAESNRAPFDIPEGESEIIGGFHTEYSGFLWAIFFLAEYAMMLILSLVMSYLFLGGNASPIPHFGYSHILAEHSFFWLLAKSWIIGLLMIWIRWTLPRLRVDQLMGMGWKVLTPVSLSVFLLIILLK